jgi:hypothetical protein
MVASEKSEGWRRAIHEGRERWRRTQNRAVVRDAPCEAVAALEAFGYTVIPRKRVRSKTTQINCEPGSARSARRRGDARRGGVNWAVNSDRPSPATLRRWIDGGHMNPRAYSEPVETCARYGRRYPGASHGQGGRQTVRHDPQGGHAPTQAPRRERDARRRREHQRARRVPRPRGRRVHAADLPADASGLARRGPPGDRRPHVPTARGLGRNIDGTEVTRDHSAEEPTG